MEYSSCVFVIALLFTMGAQAVQFRLESNSNRIVPKDVHTAKCCTEYQIPNFYLASTDKNKKAYVNFRLQSYKLEIVVEEHKNTM